MKLINYVFKSKENLRVFKIRKYKPLGPFTNLNTITIQSSNDKEMIPTSLLITFVSSPRLDKYEL